MRGLLIVAGVTAGVMALIWRQTKAAIKSSGHDLSGMQIRGR